MSGLTERDALIVELGRTGLSAYGIARDPRVPCCERTVLRVLHANDVPVRSAASSPKRRAMSIARASEAVALYVEDQSLSAKEVGEVVGVSESQVFNYLRSAGVESRPSRPTPEAMAHLQTRANEAWRSIIRQRDEEASRRGLWTREQVAAFLVVRLPTLVRDERDELLRPAMRLEIGGASFPLYRPRDVKLLARRQHASTDHRVRIHRDPDFVRRWARRRGYSKSTANKLADRATERADREARTRTGATSADERHTRWADLLAELRLENPDAAPAELYGAVALQDWQEHPEEWPRSDYPASRRDPQDFADGFVRKAARDRVRKALARKTPA